MWNSDHREDAPHFNEGTKLILFEVKYEFPSVLASREEKLWTKVKAYFVQFMSFLIGKKLSYDHMGMNVPISQFMVYIIW